MATLHSSVAATLDSLDDNVLQCIFDFIHARAHLKKCQLVNKKFHRLTLARLYRCIDVNVGGTKPTVQHQRLLENQGFGCIRELSFFPPLTGKLHPALHHWVVASLAPQLQKGQLERLTWHYKQTPLDLFRSLVPRQLNNCVIQIGAHVNPSDHFASSDVFEELSPVGAPKLKELELRPDTVDSALAGGKVLEKLPINDLLVDGIGWKEGDAHREDIDDSSKIRDKLTEALFKYQYLDVPPALRTKSSGLRFLQLTDVNLRFVRDTWFSYLELKHLSFLYIGYCHHADIFLTELMRTEPPQLRDFILIHTLWAEDRTLIELEDFLNMTKGRLRRLDLCLRNIGNHRLDLQSINKHRATLEHLLIDMVSPATGQPEATVYRGFSRDELNQLLAGCEKLSQLAVALPQVSCIYRPGELFFSNEDFAGAFAAIIFNVSLTTLNITNFPMEYPLLATAAYYSFVKPQLQRLATDLFLRAKSNTMAQKKQRLEILAWGVRDRNLIFPLPKYFVLAEVKCLYETRHIAQPVRLRDLDNDNMDVQILDHGWRTFDKELRAIVDDHPYWIDDEVRLEEAEDQAAAAIARNLRVGPPDEAADEEDHEVDEAAAGDVGGGDGAADGAADMDLAATGNQDDGEP
ncbi:hypothetical protein LTR37_014530 [Vermiconidia calcicola]|uniref:Uncharacterized protein n=1 Tax=Vermiconidia calcicola TaxID=1690605 RepID=A0ACC3MUI4_9PEZI|nr:hypothetical protein LTR37_014530 [Vermiconidia calcicola]